jgi:hypothetical protein
VASTQHLSWRVHRTQSAYNGNDENVKACYINRQEKFHFLEISNARPSDTHQGKIDREMVRMSELLMNTTIVMKRQKSESLKVRVRVSSFLHFLFIFS